MGGDRPRGRHPAGVRLTTTRSPLGNLSGPVDVSVAVPRLSLDRPFTYLLDDGMDAGTGSLVSVPFHGRNVKGWILGPASVHVAPDRLLPIRKVQSRVRFFDGNLLALFRWMNERYISPLSTVIERSHPPRVVSEERGFEVAALRPRGGPAERTVDSRREGTREAGGQPGGSNSRDTGGVLDKYGAGRLLDPGSTAWLRPLPGEEAEVCVAAVSECLAAGKQAIVLVPEAEPVPATAGAVLEAWSDRAVAFLGGDQRSRYRTWLEILEGRLDVVVGTRPAVFAPLSRLGLLWISREVHPGHREDRAPYYHVREVAMARARLEGAACVLAGLSPSVETAVGCRVGSVATFRPDRAVERAAAPLVETTPPEAEDRSVRLGSLLKKARSAALIVSRRGYGVARVCRSCGSAAACAQCGGAIVVERGRAVCSVCASPGTCAVCGSHQFGVERGGVERVAEWAERTSGRKVRQQAGEAAPSLPGEDIMVGTAASVKDWGRLHVDVVAILDPDRALSRPGIHATERAVATWMEAASWAGRRSGGGRVLMQTRHAAHPAVQAMVRWDPARFLEDEAGRRTKAGFDPLRALFRISGAGGLVGSITAAGGSSLVSTSGDGSTVCLVSVPSECLGDFRNAVLRLAADGVVARVEAEPQL
jgi:primosomal protein N' (replication factor Y) (superfamily II helicase)